MSTVNENSLVLNERVLVDLAHAYECCIDYIREHNKDEKKSFQYWESVGKIHILERIAIDRRTGPSSDPLSKAIIKAKYSTEEDR